MLYVSDITFTVNAIMYELETENSAIGIRCGLDYTGSDYSYVLWQNTLNNGVMAYMYYPTESGERDFIIGSYNSDLTEALIVGYDANGNATTVDYKH